MYFLEGKKTRIKKGYHYCGKKLLHRLIWQHYKGEIPKGHVIHHKDGNKLNNSIENLECMTQAEHSKLHRLEESESLSKRMAKNSEKLHEWHRSEEGRKSMSERGRKQFEQRPVRLCICAECGKEFSSIHTVPTKFCSNNCMSRDRRKSGKDNEERTCIICSTPFVINKYQLTKTCSKPCRAKHISNLKTKKIP
jgi:hypothetical protein